MTRKTVPSCLALAVFVFLMTLAGRGNGQLGCTTVELEETTSVATCMRGADCQVVGGIDCTNEFCFCDSGPYGPFCPCAAAEPPAAMAPATSPLGLFILIAFLGGVGLLRLWRPRRATAANS